MHAKLPATGSEISEENFQELRRLLLAQRQFDLGMYKDQCIRRRIAKRLRVLKIPELPAYLAMLRRDGREIDALIEALSIHVSQFFRNPSTFAVLERDLLPDLLARSAAAGRPRLSIWCVGCAGGEEPYSLALLLEELQPALPVSILATDISSQILEQARQGLFDPLRLTEVPVAVRERFFIPEAGGFRLQPQIRRKVVFEQHNILAPAPYPAVDLILCRNVLIYFSRREQESILGRFAAAMEEGGALVLGKAETLLGEARRWFRTENMAERIFRRTGASETA